MGSLKAIVRNFFPAFFGLLGVIAALAAILYLLMSSWIAFGIAAAIGLLMFAIVRASSRLR
ncbi:hypothetical protein ACFLW0_06190 [Chloroflexota bacterium]